MDANKIIEILTDEDIVSIMEDLGSNFPRFVSGGMLFQTICHNELHEGKHKLHYHSESKTFYCYTDCGNIGNIFNLVMKIKNCKFNESYKYVCDILGINVHNQLKHGFGTEKVDNSFIYKLNIEEDKRDPIVIRDDKILNSFWNLYHKSWIDDHISREVMRDFNIKFDIPNYRIIIPHYNINNELIGIRCRNLKEELLQQGCKYIPISVNGTLYNYATSLNLFGINKTKDNIKKYKSVVIGESEKFVMQHKSFFKNSTAVALNGSALSSYQIQMLIELGVETVILALDKEFTNDEEEKEYKNIINKKFLTKLLPLFNVEIIWDSENLLNLKDSPVDKGKETYLKLYEKRIIL